MIISKAKKSEAGQIVELLRYISGLHKEGRPDVFATGLPKYDLEAVLRLTDDENTFVITAAEGDEVLGYLIAYISEPSHDPHMKPRKTFYIDDLCVKPGSHRKGVGTALFGEAKRMAAERGCDIIDLNVWTFNTGAIRFYESMGMKASRMRMELDLNSESDMEKKRFNKAIKQAFASNGLEQSKKGEYTIVSAKQDYYVIIKIPDMINGFVIGIMPVNAELMPEFKNTWLRSYEFELELCCAESRIYTNSEIENSVNEVFSAAILISKNGKEGIVDQIDKWMFVKGEQKKNEIREWLGMPAIDCYSIEYLNEKIDILKRGGFSCVPLSEFLAHEDFYRRYEGYGFKIILDKKRDRVIISSSLDSTTQR